MSIFRWDNIGRSKYVDISISTAVASMTINIEDRRWGYSQMGSMEVDIDEYRV